MPGVVISILPIGDELQKGAYTVRFYFNPFIRLIWLGCLIMALGGIISLSDRRLRIGAPKRAKRSRAAVAAAIRGLDDMKQILFQGLLVRFSLLVLTSLLVLIFV